jgi:hypothetical protein
LDSEPFFKNEESKTDPNIYVGVLKENSLPNDCIILESDSEEEEINKESKTQHLKNLIKEIKELNQKIRRLQKEKECSVCLDGDRNILFEPCNHITMCSVCAVQVQKCPICRLQIEKKRKEKKRISRLKISHDKVMKNQECYFKCS